MKRNEQESIEHFIRLEELHEMEEVVPMTLPERNRLRKWVYSGHSVYDNPWRYKDYRGFALNYIEGYHKYLEEKWGDFYHPLYRIVPTDSWLVEGYDELSI